MQPQVRLLGDRYELQYVLASGGMGRVWCARDTLLQRPVAVKILRSEFTGDPSFVSRFRAEAQHAALLQHPNIAAVFDYGELQQDGEHLAYLVMELVEGESLATLLHRERRLDVPQTLGIMRATAAGLAPQLDARPVADVTGPQQAVAQGGRPVAPLQGQPEAAEQAGGQRGEDGEQDPHAEPAGEEEPHDRHSAPRPERGTAGSRRVRAALSGC